MSAIAEASSLVRRLAQPSPPGDSTKAAILRAWRKMRPTFSANRIKDLWYADARVRVSAEELKALRQAAIREEEKNAVEAYRSVSARLARIEAILAGAHADRAVDTENVPGAGGPDRALDL